MLEGFGGVCVRVKYHHWGYQMEKNPTLLILLIAVDTLYSQSCVLPLTLKAQLAQDPLQCAFPLCFKSVFFSVP